MSNQMSELAQLGWTQLWQVTIVASLVLVLVRVFCRHRPHLAYVLLLVVVAKCLTPPIWSSPVGVFSWTWDLKNGSEQSVAVGTLHESNEALQGNGELMDLGLANLQQTEPSAASVERTSVREPISIQAFLLLAWVCGVVVSGVFVTATWLRHVKAIRKSSKPASGPLAALHQRVSQELGMKRRVRLLVSSESCGPFCFGVVSPFIVLPDQLVSKASHESIRQVLAHELIHIRRGDTLAALLQVSAGIMWWFHPAIWWVSRQLSRERERCCDEQVVASTRCDPEQYAQGMLDVLKFKQAFRPAFLANGIRPVDVTKERLEAIMSRRYRLHSRTPWFCWVVLALGGMLVVPGAAAVSTTPADPDETGNALVGEKVPGTKPETNKTNPNRLRFGKVVECTVYDDVPGFEFLVDFDSRKVFSPPKDFNHRNGKEAIEWLQKSGVDVMGEGDYLLGIDMVALPTSQANWDNPHPRIFNQIEDGKPGTPIPISGFGKLPATYFFKTREGGRGILQIMSFTTAKGDEQPQTTQIRYKLLQTSNDEVEGAALPSSLDDEVHVASALQPLDSLIGEQEVILWREVDAAEAEHGVNSFEKFEAYYRYNAIKVHGSRILRYARGHPETAEALTCLAYLVELGEGYPPPLYRSACAELIAREKDNPALSWLCSQCTNENYLESMEDFLTQLLKISTNSTVQAAAAFNLARLYDKAAQLRPDLANRRKRFRDAGMIKADPSIDLQLDFLEKRSHAELATRCVELLKLVTEKYPDEKPWSADRTYGRLDYTFAEDPTQPTYLELADQLSYEINNTRVGSVAPDFEAADIDGRPFRLSENRGKPILLMFSFKGCGPCEAMYPRLRKVQERFSPDGFSVIGLMVDKTIDTVREAVNAGDITWPCMWIGRSSPIVKMYGVHGYPTTLLINGDGRIVSRGLRHEEELVVAIEKVVKE